MKAAFKIIPKEELNTQNHLLLEVGWEGISFILFSKTPFTIKGLSIYNFEKNLFPAELATELNNILVDEPSLLQLSDGCTICYNFKESLLIPTPFFTENIQREILELSFGSAVNSIAYHEPLPEGDMVNIFKVDKIIVEVLHGFYPEAVHMHSTSLQLKKAALNRDTIHCIVYPNSIKVFFYREDKIQLVQYFSYNIALDVAYHLLNVCAQHSVEADSITVLLSGMIDENSNLYNEIYKYFLNINLNQLPANVTLSDEVMQYPHHFFSHLISLASCVS